MPFSSLETSLSLVCEENFGVGKLDGEDRRQALT